ncbi:MAG: hypothetical protein J7578_06515 [Chitinophagaceae bacterium]|nr:hypothetical protein [Chitinophagaceae bacterium]
MLRNYFKTACRNPWKNKFYTSINIAGLAISIALLTVSSQAIPAALANPVKSLKTD